jgi:hypothetical protein
LLYDGGGSSNGMPSRLPTLVAIYVQTAILFGVYTPELFPAEIRLRANGICNTLGRAPPWSRPSSSAP